MMGLEKLGQPVVVASSNPPGDSFRHERLASIEAPILYPPPAAVLSAMEKDAAFREALGPLVEDHRQRFGESFKPELRAVHAWWMAPRLREHGVRHLHVHFANRATHVALFLAELGFTFSFTAHAQDFMVDLGNDDLLREMADRSQFVLAVSDFSRGLLATTCPKAETAGKIGRLYNGLHLDEFLPAAPAQQGELRIVSVGRLVAFKGFDVLLRALGLLHARGVPFRCHLVGEGPEHDHLTALAAELGITDSVHFDGLRSQQEIRALLAGANLFALACRIDDKGASDILPTVITEAMASGLPVVSTRIAGVPELVIDGETGRLVDAEDPEAFAQAVASFAEDAPLRARMGAAGRRRAESEFEVGKTVADLAGRFAPHVRREDSGAARTAPGILYLADSWNPGDAELALAKSEPGVEVVACTVGSTGDELPENLPVFLPDPVVLEAVWIGEDGLRRKCERLRGELPAALAGEAFFVDARRAVYLAESFSDMPVSVVHASRSNVSRLAWLVARLLGARATATIEFEPQLPRPGLAKILKEFAFVSLGDPLLGERLKGDHEDVLGTGPPPRKEYKFGPIRINRSLDESPAHLDPERQRRLLDRLRFLLPDSSGG